VHFVSAGAVRSERLFSITVQPQKKKLKRSGLSAFHMPPRSSCFRVSLGTQKTEAELANAVNDRPEHLFGCMLLGVKPESFPRHIWLPSQANAPSHGSHPSVRHKKVFM
jgi:hypothetical protein